MTDLETIIVFVFMFLPAVIFWILLIAYVTNKVFDAIERDKSELSGYDKIVEQIKQGVCEESLVDVINTLGEKKEERDEYLKHNSDYRDAKFKYVEDKLSDYLNTDEATNVFKDIFKESGIEHEWKKNIWTAHLNEKRSEYEDDFDNL